MKNKRGSNYNSAMSPIKELNGDTTLKEDFYMTKASMKIGSPNAFGFSKNGAKSKIS